MNIEDYKGKNIRDRQPTETLKKLWDIKWEMMRLNFGDNVDFERMNDDILYCRETEDYLYNSPPPAPRYERGTRPILEKVVDEVTKGLETDRERALALLVYCEDLKWKSGNRDYFYGGTEEELLKKGEKYCERLARLMVALCEVANIPARTIHHFVGGHETTEVYIESGWAYMDPRHALFCVDENDKILSVKEILENRDVIFNQPKWVVDMANKEYPYEKRQKMNAYCFFCPGERQLFAEYHLGDADRYHFEWMPSTEAFAVPERDNYYREEYAPIRRKVLAEIGATYTDF
jgi:hypothetical protein